MRACLALVVALVVGCNLEQSLNADSATTGVDSDEGAGTDATGTLPPAACNGRTLRVATFNIESVNEVGSASYEAVPATLARIDADLVCVQEIVDGEAVGFSALAEQAGYAFAFKAERSPGIGGELSNGCMARVPLSIVGSWGSELSADPAANDVGRDFLAVRIALSQGDAACNLGVLTVHLKSGSEPVDAFRRQVEAQRLVSAVARYRDDYPSDPIVVLGDFNEQIDDAGLDEVFDSAPAGLPDTFRLGGDIVFPLTYQPFATLQGAALQVTSPGQEDAPLSRDTWRDTSRLDYIWLGDAELVAGEVYNSCRDDGVDDDPPGDNLTKAGAPLDCGVSSTASDHFPVVADIRLP